MALLSSLSGVFSCMIMIMLGFYLSRIKWFDGDTSKLFSRLAMFVSIPLYMLWSMMKSYTKADLMPLGFVVLVPAIVQLVCWIIGIGSSVALGIPQHRRGAFRAMTFVSNSAFIGFPVVMALFGDKALPLALMFYLVLRRRQGLQGRLQLRRCDDRRDDHLRADHHPGLLHPAHAAHYLAST